MEWENKHSEKNRLYGSGLPQFPIFSFQDGKIFQHFKYEKYFIFLHPAEMKNISFSCTQQRKPMSIPARGETIDMRMHTS